MQKTIRLSSNWTIVLKIVIPIIWLSFFASLLLASLLANAIEAPQVANASFKMNMVIFIISGLVFFYFTLFRIKRADADGQFIYISNYFKTVRYTLNSVKEYELYDHLLFKAIHIHLHEKGRFGKRIIILPKMIHFKVFIEETGQSIKLRNAESGAKSNP
ncbi:MAG TPA: hypothetical protein PLU49_03225 [Saprospiraceae bacterium]|nr:hypothetical protein [Saprospiraceae bacterium]